MKSYVETVLMRDEQIIYAARLHWIIYFWGFFFTLVGWALSLYGVEEALRHLIPNLRLPVKINELLNYGVFGLVVLGVLSLLHSYVKQVTTELAVTNRRVLAKHGVIARTSFELFLTKVEGVNVDQSVLGRILGFGSIHVKGTGGGMSPIDEIYYPEFFQRVLLEQIRRRQDAVEASNNEEKHD